MEDNNRVKYSFKYTDEFGQTTELNKELNYDAIEEVSSSYDSLVDVFVEFLKACGYADKTITERITIQG